MLTRHDLVAIEWDDASTLDFGWQHGEAIEPEPQLACTVGFLYKRTKDHLVVHSTFDAGDGTVHHFQIPRKMVREMQILVPKGSEICPLALPAVANKSS